MIMNDVTIKNASKGKIMENGVRKKDENDDTTAKSKRQKGEIPRNKKKVSFCVGVVMLCCCAQVVVK